MSHTLGPWINEGGNSKGQRCIYSLRGDDVVFIAGVEIPIHDTDNLTKHEAEANAKLIASAPDLLKALTRMLNMFDRLLPEKSIGAEVCNEAKEAISKATK